MNVNHGLLVRGGNESKAANELNPPQATKDQVSKAVHLSTSDESEFNLGVSANNLSLNDYNSMNNATHVDVYLTSMAWNCDVVIQEDPGTILHVHIKAQTPFRTRLYLYYDGSKDNGHYKLYRPLERLVREPKQWEGASVAQERGANGGPGGGGGGGGGASEAQGGGGAKGGPGGGGGGGGGASGAQEGGPGGGERPSSGWPSNVPRESEGDAIPGSKHTFSSGRVGTSGESKQVSIPRDVNHKSLSEANTWRKENLYAAKVENNRDTTGFFNKYHNSGPTWKEGRLAFGSDTQQRGPRPVSSTDASICEQARPINNVPFSLNTSSLCQHDG